MPYSLFVIKSLEHNFLIFLNLFKINFIKVNSYFVVYIGVKVAVKRVIAYLTYDYVKKVFISPKCVT